MSADNNKFYINEDAQLYFVLEENITKLENKKARSPGLFFMDENILCFKNSKNKVFKLFGHEKNELLDNPSIWKPYRLISDIHDSFGKNHAPLFGEIKKDSKYISDIARISWINGSFTIQTFGANKLEKMIIVREYNNGSKTITKIEGQELNNFLSVKELKKKPKI